MVKVLSTSLGGTCPITRPGNLSLLSVLSLLGLDTLWTITRSLSSEEVLTEERGRSRVTSISLDPGNEGEDELQGSDPVDPRSRRVEVVRQVDQKPPTVRKTVMPNQLVRYNGEWAVQKLPEIQYPPEFRELRS